MTRKQIMNLKEGTKIRIRAGATAYIPYLQGGFLVFQDNEDREPGEHVFGIDVVNGACYMFSPEEIELIPDE